jgi:outer membrane protein assembly factor BamA
MIGFYPIYCHRKSRKMPPGARSLYMKLVRKSASTFLVVAIFSLLWAAPIVSSDDVDTADLPVTTQENNESKAERRKSAERTIKSITVEGNHLVPTEAILQHFPYRIGEVFNKQQRRTALRTVYFGIKKLRHIELRGKNSGNSEIDLILVVKESPKTKEVVFKGNKVIASKDIRKKLNLQDLQTIEKEELNRLANEIKKLYADKKRQEN